MICRFFLALFICIPITEIQAEDVFGRPLPSTVKVEYGWDASDGNEQFVDLDYALESGVRVIVGTGNTSFKKTNTASKSQSWIAGLSSNPLDMLVYSVVYENWNRNESNSFNSNILRLDRDTVVATVRWQTLNWSAALSPRQRNINIRPASTNVVIGIRSPGYGASISYYGLDKLSVTLDQLEYDYSNDIDLLKSIAARSLTLAARIADQFDESRSRIILAYNLERASLGLEWQRNVVVANLDVYKALIMNVFIDLDKHWSLQGKLGKPVGGSLSSDSFGSIAASYRW